VTSLADFQAAGFPVGGELLGLDLADTLVTVTDPPTDLLAGPGRLDAWWRLQADRLPAEASAPASGPTFALREALRSVLDAAVAGAPLPADAAATVNRFAAGAPTSPALLGVGRLELRWHASRPAAIALAVTATSVIELLGGSHAERLRRCANPACSMLFVSTDARRRFCTQNVCGNRVRVARFHQRQRAAARQPAARATD